MDDDNLNQGDFVLVRFDQIKGKQVFFIGQIQTVFEKTDFDIKFLRRHNQYFIFPIIDDIAQINRTDIISKLPEPTEIPGTLRTKGYYRFEVDLIDYNMK